MPRWPKTDEPTQVDAKGRKGAYGRGWEYVHRNSIKKWLLANARPVAVEALIEGFMDNLEPGPGAPAEGNARRMRLDLEMLRAVYRANRGPLPRHLLGDR